MKNEIKIFKQAKIVATIGPVTETEEMLTKLVNAGLDVARFNMSHGTHEEHLKRFHVVRAVSKKLNKAVAVLQDLSGPKIRIGEFSTPTIELIPGEKFTITIDDIVGDENRVSVNYKKLPQNKKLLGSE